MSTEAELGFIQCVNCIDFQDVIIEKLTASKAVIIKKVSHFLVLCCRINDCQLPADSNAKILSISPAWCSRSIRKATVPRRFE